MGRFFSILCLLLMVFVSTDLSAGTFSAAETDTCTLRFSGQISSGDAADLARNVPAIPTGSSQSTYDTWLCLNSPGGSLTEALRMGQVLRAGGMATRLEPGASCLSACAILFMSGTVYDPDVGFDSQINLNAFYPRRMMHVSATLGFHRPSIKLDTDKRFDAGEVERSFDISTEASLELVRLVGQGILATDLVEEMFAHRGSDFFLIDTVGKTLRWNIFTDGESLPRRMDSRAAFDACTALVALETGYRSGPSVYRGAKTVEILSKPSRDGAGVIFWVTPEPERDYAFHCMVGLSPETEETMILCGYYGPKLSKIGAFRCDSVGDAGEFFWQPTAFNTVYALPLETPLLSMKAKAAEIEARAAREMAQEYDFGRDAFRRRCMAFEGRVRIDGVQNFATLRAAPDLSSQVVSQLPLGSRVQAADKNVSVAVATTGQQTCLRLCQSSLVLSRDSVEWRALNACYDNNALWYPVFDTDYQRGFVSGKFLRY